MDVDVVVAYFKVLCQHLLEITKEYHEDFHSV